MFSYIIKKESCLLSYNIEIEKKVSYAFNYDLGENSKSEDTLDEYTNK